MGFCLGLIFYMGFCYQWYVLEIQSWKRVTCWAAGSDHWEYWHTGAENLGCWLPLLPGCPSPQEMGDGQESKLEAEPFSDGECPGGLFMSVVRAQMVESLPWSKVFTKGLEEKWFPACNRNKKALSPQCPVSSSVKWVCWEGEMG